MNEEYKMLKFKTFLNESNNIKYVYHSTHDNAAKNILKHNYFRVSKNVETGVPGLSTTFDSKYIWGAGDVRFKIDLNKIKKKYKTINVDTLPTIENESEILIINDGAILNINKYIESIDVKNNSSVIDQAIEYGKKYNIKINKVDKFK